MNHAARHECIRCGKETQSAPHHFCFDCKNDVLKATKKNLPLAQLVCLEMNALFGVYQIEKKSP